MKKPFLTNSDEIQEYIKDLRKIPVMTYERQDEIFLELQNKKITKERQKQLFDELVTGNLRFVITISKMYQNSGMDLIDIISEGNIGLIKAAERFDPSSGFKFISYAVWWIKQSIMSSLNENVRTIRLPSNIVQENQKKKKNNQLSDEQFLTNQSTRIFRYLKFIITMMLL
jgi:RNA polymerase primary sigma factor